MAISGFQNLSGVSANLSKALQKVRQWFFGGTAAMQVQSAGLKDVDTDYYLQLKSDSTTALTANRILTLDVNNAARILKITGNPTIADWFDQAVKTTSAPTFAGLLSTDSITINKATGNGIKVDTAAPAFGWRDLVGKITNSKGATKPTETTYRDSIEQFKFSEGDDAVIEYHIPHDYVAGTDIHLHVHWSHNSNEGDIGGGIVCTYEITYCKGHNQAAFPASVTGTIPGTASATRYKHIVSEGQISASTPSGSQIATDDLEPDGMILCRFEMTANNMTSGGVVPDPFFHEVDIHYQSTNIATKKKIPDFYT